MAHPPLASFQIGWICALPIELAAAVEMLDEKYGSPDSQDTADSNTYTLGRIGKHNIVIACLPAGQYGETPATTVANNMVRTFTRSLRVGLMVGVGGGIPSAGHDIRLGDIVVSCPKDTSGGVLQYDMGKVGVAGVFHRTGSLNSPPRSLLTALSAMRAAEIADDPIFPKYLTSAIARTERTRKNFARPNIQQDRLFRPECDHPAPANNCDKCLAEWEVTRTERQTSDPQLHYGMIASGNAVIKHGCTREQLRLETGALCVEMEAAGLMMDFPCLVVRGICDYADSHKNKQWQGYAALSAASYAKELLGYIAAGQVLQERLVVDSCNELRDGFQGLNQRLDRAYDQQEKCHREKTSRALTEQQQKCHQGFKISNYTDQKNINPRRIEGTCEWAFQSPEYTRWWVSNCNDLLWVSADPGCGKSVLARSIVDDVEASFPELTICYFFFKDNDEQSRLAVALCSVLHQLFSQQPYLLDHALPHWERNGEKLRQEADELWHILLTATSTSRSCKTICILDALDECCEIDQRRLIEKLESFHAQNNPPTQENWLKFLVTSRPYDQIQNGFHMLTDSFPHIHLKGEEENDLIQDEINLVVKLKVEELARTARLSPEIQQRLETRLLELKNRTYLWLHLAIDDIRDTFANSLWPAEESIQLIPASVDAAYRKILSQVPSQSENTVKRIFEIVIAARRPLTISEMAMALGVAIRPQCQAESEAGIDERDFDKKLRRLCGLFVFINHSKVYFVHETAKEFLLQNIVPTSASSCHDRWQYSITSQDAQRTLAIICVTYLDFLNNTNGVVRMSDVFLNYAAKHWSAHFVLAEFAFGDDIVSRTLRICDPQLVAFSIWWREGNFHFRMPFKVTSLMIASYFGLEAVVEAMIKRGDPMESKFHSPLSLAAEEGHQAVVGMLLENGAKTEPKLSRSPISYAAKKGHRTIVEMLLKRGAETNSKRGPSAIEYAAENADWALVDMLLENGADAEPKGHFRSPICYAAHCGNRAIVEKLLEKGAGIESVCRFETPLTLAAMEGHLAVVEFLLEHDAKTEPEEMESPLSHAAGKGHVATVKTLLMKGADPEFEYWGQTPLSLAAENGHSEVTMLLLDMGAKADPRDANGRTPLSFAACNGHADVVRLLLATRKVNPDPNDYGRPHLSSAAKGAYHEIARLLREKGVNVTPKFNGRTPLSYAAENGHDEVVKMLLREEKVDPNLEDSRGLTPLSYARTNDHRKVVSLLLSKGARDTP